MRLQFLQSVDIADGKDKTKCSKGGGAILQSRIPAAKSTKNMGSCQKTPILMLLPSENEITEQSKLNIQNVQKNVAMFFNLPADGKDNPM